MESIKRYNPFYYPKERHERTQSPKAYARYQSYKPYLKIEFSNRCVYCRKPDYFESYFTVDHYKPKEMFPELELDYSNLYYCCPGCNSRKRTFWPTAAQRRKQEFIPNPCDHVMFDHLQFRHLEVNAKTAAGRIAEFLLQLNSNSASHMRETYLRNIKALIEAANTLERRLSKLRGLMAEESDEDRIRQIQSSVDTLERERESTLSALRSTSGVG